MSAHVTGGPARQSHVGFAGLGRMGAAMAANLVAAGHRIVAYVRQPDQADRLSALGLEPTTVNQSPAG
jgi:3-hydroxyisobutyrate dehydrogenase-like beta-hydroxyacid dehydrogenase